MTALAKNDWSMKSVLRSAARRTRQMFTTNADFFLNQIIGVIHVGGNLGQERDAYASRGLRVLWIEPNPEVFERLQRSITDFPRQRALSCLVTDMDDRIYPFHIADNEGQSSSILELAAHKDVWPEISFAKTIELRGVTLASLLKRENVRVADYDALVLDTQGSEMLVLRGAQELLGGFQFIKAEVADFESYKGCCRLPEMDAFLTQHGFHRVLAKKFWVKKGVGTYYEVVYQADRVR
jgi:FkbM family methyltransferase